MSKTVLAWHFTCGVRFRDGTAMPPEGRWPDHDGEITRKETGLRAQENMLDACAAAKGSMIHRVEMRQIIEKIGYVDIIGKERQIIASEDIRDLLRDFARFAAWTAFPMWNVPDTVREWVEMGNEELRDAAYRAADDTWEPFGNECSPKAMARQITETATNVIVTKAAYHTADGMSGTTADRSVCRKRREVFEELLTNAVRARLGLKENE